MGARGLLLLTVLSFVAATYWLVYQPEEERHAGHEHHEHHGEHAAHESSSVAPREAKKFYKINEPAPSRKLASQKFQSKREKLEYLSKLITEETSHSSFKALLKEAYSAAPTIEEMKSEYSKEHHRTPSTLTDYAVVVGAIEDQVRTHPSLLESAMSFYKSCGQDKQLVHPMRTVCAAKFFDHQARQGQALETSAFSSRVSRTGKMLMIESN